MPINLPADVGKPCYPELRGKVAIVTGSNRGIGKGIAARLGREGMRLVLNGRTVETLRETEAEFREEGLEVIAYPGDVSMAEVADRLFASTMEAYGRVDVLVNNAAVVHAFRYDIMETDEKEWDDVATTNIKMIYQMSHRAAKIMAQNGGGNIVNISSVGGLRAQIRSVPYDASKGAMDAATRAMAIDLAPYGIRVNAVAPGATIARKPESEREQRRLEGAKMIPLRRMGTVADIAAAVAFLVSDQASYITGIVLYVDGGLTAQLTPPGIIV